jgi:hypothetical protein
MFWVHRAYSKIKISSLELFSSLPHAPLWQIPQRFTLQVKPCCCFSTIEVGHVIEP